jgi:hypothetical protein
LLSFQKKNIQEKYDRMTMARKKMTVRRRLEIREEKREKGT